MVNEAKVYFLSVLLVVSTGIIAGYLVCNVAGCTPKGIAIATAGVDEAACVLRNINHSPEEILGKDCVGTTIDVVEKVSAPKAYADKAGGKCAPIVVGPGK